MLVDLARLLVAYSILFVLDRVGFGFMGLLKIRHDAA
jgi:hypothetical protein